MDGLYRSADARCGRCASFGAADDHHAARLSHGILSTGNLDGTVTREHYRCHGGAG